MLSKVGCIECKYLICLNILYHKDTDLKLGFYDFHCNQCNM